MGINTKDKRIAKLFLKGVPIKTITRKIGMPNNVTRVLQGLEREGIKFYYEWGPDDI